MSYSEVFGGGTINPAQKTYITLTFSADVQLSWPIEQQIGGDNIVADIIDLDATAGGLNVDIPDARAVSTGYTSLFNNIGSNTCTIRDAAGGTIIAPAPGEAWFVYLTDNSTIGGTWATFQLGATVSVASASALAGAGIKAISTTLNQTALPRSDGSTPVTVVDSDRANVVIWTGGAGVADLPTPGTVGTDWFFMLRNSGSGDLTVTPPSGLIDGGATLTMGVNQSAIILTDGIDFFTVGFGQTAVSIFDFITIAIPGSGDFVLTGVQLNRISYRFTGILTGNRKIVVPNTTQEYWADNQTTGAFTLTIGTAAQVTPPEITQGMRAIFYCDSVDVVNATTQAVITFPLSIAQGGTASTTAAGARVALSVPPNTRLLTAGGGLTGGGDLTSDRTFDVGAGTGITVNANDIQTDDGAIDHDALLNFVANEHVDHSAVSLSAGTGISAAGLGDISASRTINCNLSNTTTLGVVERATQAEVDAGVDTTRYLTPNTFDLSAQLLAATGDIVVTTGTFFPGFTGFSVNPTLELRWTRYNPNPTNAFSYACMSGIGGTGFGTSNAVTFAWTGIASEAAPSTIATGVTNNILCQDNTTFNHDTVGVLNTIPNMNWLINTGTGQYDLNSFTASGTKGTLNAVFVCYFFTE